MFERFTEPSRRVVVLAQEEARMLDHNYIGTEHILLGLIHEGEGVAARAIVSTRASPSRRPESQVRERVGVGKQAPTGHIPFTPRAKKVLELSLREALALKKELHRHRAHPARPGPGGSRGGRPDPGRDRPAGSRQGEGAPAGCRRVGRAGARRAAGGGVAGGRAAAGRRRSPAAAGAPLSASGPRSSTSSGRRSASIGETLAALEHRLTGIERQLGITPAAPGEGSEGPDESTDAPEGDASEESAE